MTEPDKILWEHPHGGNLLRFAIRSYKGKSFAELRSWYPAADGWRHGAKGCTMPLERIGELGRALTGYEAAPDADRQSDSLTPLK